MAENIKLFKSLDDASQSHSPMDSADQFGTYCTKPVLGTQGYISMNQ